LKSLLLGASQNLLPYRTQALKVVHAMITEAQGFLQVLLFFPTRFHEDILEELILCLCLLLITYGDVSCEISTQERCVALARDAITALEKHLPDRPRVRVLICDLVETLLAERKDPAAPQDGQTFYEAFLAMYNHH
jgi:hypothetical protein